MTTRLLFLALCFAVPAQAQRLTLGATAGGSSANPDLGFGVDWKSGWSADANLTYRLSSTFGIRGDAALAQNDLAGAPGVPGEQRFNKISYMADAVLQGNALGGTRLMPYALAGVGAVRIHDKGADSSFTRFGGNVGVGVGYRFGKFGLRAEGRDVIYKFDRFGFNKTQNDVLWQAGLTLGL